uniref:Putative DNA recombination protein n=1 Tax=viral metagenome TaxID=1070528 RepID=A0A6M3M4H7_9ZZZZ
MSNDLITKKKKVKDLLLSPSSLRQLQCVLPDVGITKERMVRLIFSAINQNPKLLEATPNTLFNAMILSASLGLEPNTPLGQAYLIPFRDRKANTMTIQFIVGYKGFLSLARRSGEIAFISSHVVREGDLFEYQYGTDEFLKHIPSDSEGQITHAYCVARLRDGSTAFEIMTRKQIDSIRARSMARDAGPWVTDYEQMARKTTIRRLMNYLPLSTEQARAVSIDGKQEVGGSAVEDLADIIDVDFSDRPEEESPPKSKLSEMAKKANRNNGCPPNPEPKEKGLADEKEEAIAGVEVGDGSGDLTETQASLLGMPEALLIAAKKRLGIKKELGKLSDEECETINKKANELADGEGS